MARVKRTMILEDEKYISGFNRHYFMRALRYLSPYKKIVVVSLAAMIVCMLCGLAAPWLTGKAIDVCASGGSYSTLLLIVAGLAGAAGLGALMLRTKVRLMNVTGRRALAAMREDLFNHIQTLGFDFFDSRPAGKIMVRVINDVESLLNMFSQGIVNMLSNAVSIVAIAGIMLGINWRLALVAFSMLPLLFRADLRDTAESQAGLAREPLEIELAQRLPAREPLRHARDAGVHARGGEQPASSAPPTAKYAARG